MKGTSLNDSLLDLSKNTLNKKIMSHAFFAFFCADDEDEDAAVGKPPTIMRTTRMGTPTRMTYGKPLTDSPSTTALAISNNFNPSGFT
jgi:hypothetical protein